MCNMAKKAKQTFSDTTAPSGLPVNGQPPAPVLPAADKMALMETLLALSRFEQQLHNVINAAKAREMQLNKELEVAFKNASADPNIWMLNKESFQFERRVVPLNEGQPVPTPAPAKAN
jgi:hypothetical protein